MIVKSLSLDFTSNILTLFARYYTFHCRYFMAMISRIRHQLYLLPPGLDTAFPLTTVDNLLPIVTSLQPTVTIMLPAATNTLPFVTVLLPLVFSCYHLLPHKLDRAGTTHPYGYVKNGINLKRIGYISSSVF
jgi:hypothetical protein